ncbi:MAG: hypothetical protein JWM78_1848 [Verrucomicrobiaceae bacterium]|nr:hypothetical protein [Verrucomicrobiaceae bacterium]
MFAVLDKLIFGIGLILATQIPQLVDQYDQFLSGFYQATKEQVDAFTANATRHDYADLNSMIADLSHNENPVVRDDAEQKRAAVIELRDLEKGRDVFKTGNIFKKLAYMLNPTRYRFLQHTVEGFSWGYRCRLMVLSRDLWADSF